MITIKVHVLVTSFFLKIQVKNLGCGVSMETSEARLFRMRGPNSSPHFKAWLLGTRAYRFNCLRFNFMGRFSVNLKRKIVSREHFEFFIVNSKEKAKTGEILLS